MQACSAPVELPPNTPAEAAGDFLWTPFARGTHTFALSVRERSPGDAPSMFRAAISQTTTSCWELPAEIDRACEHGFDISLDEIGAVLSGLELSDAELEMVDGGDPPGGACQWSPIQQSSTW